MTDAANKPSAQLPLLKPGTGRPYCIGREPVVPDATKAVTTTHRSLPRLQDPARVVQVRNGRHLARVCADLQIGEYHCACKTTLGGWFLTPEEHALALRAFDRRKGDLDARAAEKIRESKRRYNARMRAEHAGEKLTDTEAAFVPPSGAERKARDSYQSLVTEWVSLGHPLTQEARLSLWARARAFYGLPATDSPPDAESEVTHAERLVEIASTRISEDGSRASEADLTRRRQEKRRTLGRGHVGNGYEKRGKK